MFIAKGKSISFNRGRYETEAHEKVVTVRSVSKKFCKNLRRSMAYGISDLTKNLFSIKTDSNELRRDEFWALKGLTFELSKGDVVGLIGANGSGKTTLLRLLAGILPPDTGEIRIRGRVSALIALGAGFHPHMTGRENIFLNGTILGLSYEEIKMKFDEIVAFAEIRDFLEAPISTYSSGMKVRLGFAIAIQTQPEVILIDEVLAVGDLSFRARCLEKLDQIRSSGTTIVFVSHNRQAVKSLCNRVLYFRNGIIQASGPPADMIELYIMENRKKQSIISGFSSKVVKKRSIGPGKSFAFGTEQGSIKNAVFTGSGTQRSTFAAGDIINAKVEVFFSESIKNPAVSLIIQDQNLVFLGGKYIYLKQNPDENGITETSIVFAFKALLREGSYFLTFCLEDRSSDMALFPIDKQICALAFEITSNQNDQLIGTVDFNINCVEELNGSSFE